jgi:hypothetical protein
LNPELCLHREIINIEDPAFASSGPAGLTDIDGLLTERRSGFLSGPAELPDLPKVRHVVLTEQIGFPWG